MTKKEIVKQLKAATVAYATATSDCEIKKSIIELVKKLIPNVHYVSWRADRWVAADEFSAVLAEGYVDCSNNEGKILITVIL